MRRRRVLALLGLAAGNAGCQSLLAPRESRETLTPVAVPEATATPTVAPEPTVAPVSPWYERTALADLATVARTVAVHPRPPPFADVRAEVGVFRGATTGGPALVEVALTNTGDGARAFVLGPTPPVGDRTGRRPDDDARLLLVPVAETDLSERRFEDACLHPAESPREPTGSETVVLEPGEAVRNEYALFDHPENDTCLPPGVYTFRTAYGWRFTVGVWLTSRPGPTATSRFAGRDVQDPPGGDHAWYHDADDATAVFLRPAPERTALPDSVRFVLRNHSRTVVAGSPDEFGLFKLHAGAWRPVVVRYAGGGRVHVPPGGAHRWTLTLGDGRLPERTVGRPVEWLGGGLYAFRVGLERTSDDGRPHAALVRLDGPPVTVVPEPDVEIASRDGGTVVVRDADRDLSAVRRASLVVARVEGTRDGTALPVLVPERAMQVRGLRNTLGFFEEGVDRVRFETDTGTADGVVFPRDRPRFRFDGEPFLVHREAT